MRFVELFAGIGLFRFGLESIGPQWQCVLANDNSASKARAYALNFGTAHLLHDDISYLKATHIPNGVDLITASFPCQDVSLAGNRAGLNGARTGTFHEFTRLLRELRAKHRLPASVLLENVTGLLTSHQRQDIRQVLQTLNELGYGLDLLLLDAAHWLPQSRPRIFILGRAGHEITPPIFTAQFTAHPARSAQIEKAINANPDLNWAFLNLPPLPVYRKHTLKDVICTGQGDWYAGAELARELSYIRHASRERLEAAQRATRQDKETRYLAGYRRMRDGLVCLELRGDDLAGCLRTPTGGSSRQLLVQVTAEGVGVRPMLPREYARLMGVPDSFQMPQNTREALHGFGDAVAVPVIQWLGQVLETQGAPAHAPALPLVPVA